ncbi:plexin-A2 [Strongylocentrotus purpuratus]|uniref:Sema domain-containing protein n=1 Tax=Strongylocentrotus purpuratus TaxID=7668 RepID=A0A7M7N0W2_STRPU|nr:plexin-A2 [Strongylocentrotus purpuratus]
MEQEHKMMCNLLLTQNGRTSSRLYALVSIFLCFVIFLHHPNSVDGTLETYAPVEFISKAEDPKFANLAVDERTGDMYIGAENSLFHLHSDFSLQEEVNTAPDPAECQDPQTPCKNYNRILAVVPSPIEKLITCGSFSRRCQYRQLVNISDSVEYERIVINAKTPAVAVLHDDYMYVGVSPEFPAPANHPTYVTQLHLDSLSLRERLNSQHVRASQAGFSLNFVNGFEFEGFTYFVTNQQQLIDEDPPADHDYISKINRVCQDGDSFDSFTEVQLTCSLANGRTYNLIQAIEVSIPGNDLGESFNSSDPLLYAVFAESSEFTDEAADPAHSALCIYKMSELLAKFKTAVEDCTSKGEVEVHGIRHLQSRCNNIAPLDIDLCNVVWAKYARGTEPLQAEALIPFDEVLATSIRTVTVENETVALIGTSTGNLLKVHISDATHARMYEDVKVGDTRVQQDTYFNATDDHLYLLTEQKLVRLSVVNCSQYTTCEGCIGDNGGQDGDPYCGWCTLEARCTRYQECEKKEVPTRWLPFDSEQCIDISDTSLGFSVPKSTPSKQIVISVSQLPPLSQGSGYECRFNEYTSRVTDIDGNQITCQTPPQDIIPEIESGQSAVTVALSIYSNETRVVFVKKDFNFYDCSLISSCSTCMNSSWACDWCIYDNKCTHDQGTCQQDDDDTIISSNDANAIEQCPAIIAPEPSLLLSVGIEKSFQFAARNLPFDATKVMGYECVLEYEGRQHPTIATVTSSTLVTCQSNMYTYTTNSPNIKASVSVRWNGSNVIDDDNITVTLYNCSVDRDSCSRCLSPDFTHSDLSCQWCGSTCAVMNSTLCTAPGVTPVLQGSGVCANPRITDISPTSGPIEGKTIVTISGTDIGQSVEDLVSVTLGESNCNFTDMKESYDPGRSVSCRTSAGPVGPASAVIVLLLNGVRVNGTGGLKFNYEDPSITSIFPTEGLEAGGTQVTVTGQFLNTGSSISAMFGDSPCIFKSPPTSMQGVCTTTSASRPDMVNLTMVFDGATRYSQQLFHFLPNPEITTLSTLKTIKAGGSRIEVRGSGFDVIQSPVMKATFTGGESSQESCMKRDDTTISCTSPTLPAGVLPYVPVNSRKRRASSTDPLASATLSFILDGYNFTYGEDLVYYPNPVYERFSDEGNVRKYEEDIIIAGMNLDLASTKADVEVMVGDQNGTVRSLAQELLIFSPPKVKPGLGTMDNSSKGMPLVVVKHGHLVTRIGWIDYSAVTSGNMMLIVILSGVGCLIVIVVFILVMCYASSRKRYKNQLEQVKLEMTELEDAVKNEATKAFFDIQQDMSGIKDQLQDLGGMPFVTGQDYIRNMLFVGLDVQPMIIDPQRPEENLTRAMTDFSKLLMNKDFLLVFIRSLDEDKKLAMRDRNNIASLLTVCMVLEGKLSYLSDVMLTMMSEQITNAADVDRYRQLFRNVESIVEKILANWMALCMYKYIQKHVAYPLYMLYQAIKFQVEKGPIDIITGHAHFSLNYEYLLDEDVTFAEVGLEVENQVQKGETSTVKVLDVDTITQVKEKVLDAVFLNKPQSERKIAAEVDLVLRSGKLGQLVLRDTDNTTEKPDVPRWAKVNTIQHYRITDGAVVGLVYKQDNPNASLATPLDEETELLAPSPAASPKRFPVALQRFNTNVESDLEEGFQFYHISNLYEDDATKKTIGRRGRSSSSTRIKHRKIREIYLRRLVSTKKSIQTFVDEALQVMLSVSNERPLPKSLKYLFDFLDRQASRHNLKSDTAELWKTSCLPLRFWVTVLNHPSYVFDMSQTRTVDACLNVLTQMLDNACKGIVPKYNFETSPSRVLYASELPGYIDMIPEFYKEIKEQPRVRQEEVDEEFADVCETFQGTFSKIGTLHQLYEYASRRNDTLIDALEEDEQCQRANMGYKLEQIGQMLAQGQD